MDNVESLDFRRPEKWSFGVGLCVKCFHVFKVMKHTEADPKTAECAECGNKGSFFISGKLLSSIIEDDLLE